jgi:hypothetical protein
MIAALVVRKRVLEVQHDAGGAEVRGIAKGLGFLGVDGPRIVGSLSGTGTVSPFLVLDQFNLMLVCACSPSRHLW